MVAEAAREQARFEERETILTGPIFGPRMTAPTDEPAAREARVLAAWELTPEHFARFAKLTSGTRRPLVVWPEDLRTKKEPDGMRFRIRLAQRRLRNHFVARVPQDFRAGRVRRRFSSRRDVNFRPSRVHRAGFAWPPAHGSGRRRDRPPAGRAAPPRCRSRLPGAARTRAL